MVDTAVYSQFLVRMASQTIGRVGAICDGVHDLLSRTVMTGGTGTGSVGGNIVLNAFDFSPVRHNMTVVAELARRIIGEIIGADFHRMRKRTMVGPLIGVTSKTADLGPVQTLLNGLPNDSGVKECVGVVVTVGTGNNRDNTVQSVDVSRAGQGAVSRVTENRGVAGMAVGARSVDDPVVVRRVCIVEGVAILMAAIAAITRGYFTPDSI